MLIPPNISLTYEFDFNSINIPATKMNFEKRSGDLKSKENISNKTKDTKSWINNKERNDLNQLLKRIDVGVVDRDKKAKGAIKTKTLIKTYLIE